MRFDISKISVLRYHLVYIFTMALVSFVLYFLFQLQALAFWQGFITSTLVLFVFNELRMGISRDWMFFKIANIWLKSKANGQLFLIITEFFLLAAILFSVVLLQLNQSFFLGFFIAYFSNLITLVLSSKLPEGF